MGTEIWGMSIYVVLWLIAAIGFIVTELLTVGLTTIWFAAGAVAALLVAAADGSFLLQIVAFLIVSIVLLVFTRPLAVKYINRSVEKTNVGALTGERARITERVDNLNQTGRAVVKGQDWSVRTVDDNVIIEQGSLVEVMGVTGVKLIVKQIKEEL